MYICILLYFLPLFVLQPSDALKLPAYIKPCKKSDPKLDECVVKHGNAAIPTILKGDAKYRVPLLNPLSIDEIKVQQGTKQIGLNLILKKCKIHGLENTKLVASRTNIDGRHVEWDFKIPRIVIDSNYQADGRVLILPITGKGKANVTLTDLTITYKYDWAYFKKGNKDYANVTSSEIVFDNGKTYFDLQNLFNGDKFLGDNMNRFLNENWREVTKELGPAVGQAFSNIFAGLLTRIAEQVPFEEVYPN